MNAFQNGALIAIAAGSLFAAACKKEETKPADKPAPTEAKPADPKPADPKADPAKPNVAPTNADKPKTVEKTDNKIHCGGVNSCAGKGGCASENNACAGKNGCGGQGWVEMTEDDCKAKNGKVIAAKEKK